MSSRDGSDSKENEFRGRREKETENENESTSKRKTENVSAQTDDKKSQPPLKIAKVDPLKPDSEDNEKDEDGTQDLKKTEEGGTEEKKSSYTDLDEEELDKKIEAMKQPLYCKLCESTLSNPTQAQQHYNGKPHMKKVRAYKNQAALDATLARMAAKSGQGIPTFSKDEESGKDGDDDKTKEGDKTETTKDGEEVVKVSHSQ
jgi:hypothetical protein